MCGNKDIKESNVKIPLRFCTVVLILILLAGCGNTGDIGADEDVLEENVAADLLTEALHAFYSFNANDRYNELAIAFDEQTEQLKAENKDQKLISLDDGSIETLLREYYVDLATVCTDDCLARMWETREPFQYERLISDTGSKVTVESIEYEEGAQKNLYYYTVILDLEDTDDHEYLKATGKIQTIETEAGWRIGDLIVNRISREDGSLWSH